MESSSESFEPEAWKPERLSHSPRLPPANGLEKYLSILYIMLVRQPIRLLLHPRGPLDPSFWSLQPVEYRRIRFLSKLTRHITVLLLTLKSLDLFIDYFINLHADNPVCAIPGLESVPGFGFCGRYLETQEISDLYRQRIKMVEFQQPKFCTSQHLENAYLSYSHSKDVLRNGSDTTSSELLQALQNVEENGETDVIFLKKMYCDAYDYSQNTMNELQHTITALKWDLQPELWVETSFKFVKYERFPFICDHFGICPRSQTATVMNKMKGDTLRTWMFELLVEQLTHRGRQSRDQIIMAKYLVDQKLQETSNRKRSRFFDSFAEVSDRLCTLEELWTEALTDRIIPQGPMIKEALNNMNSVFSKLVSEGYTVKAGHQLKFQLEIVAKLMEWEIERYKSRATNQLKGVYKYLEKILVHLRTFWVPKK